MAHDDLDLTLDKFNSGMRKGYNSALRILREVDRDLESPNMDDTWGDGYITYNVSKDLIHKIYGLIKKDMEECTNE